jgi:hypothetical protein
MSSSASAAIVVSGCAVSLQHVWMWMLRLVRVIVSTIYYAKNIKGILFLFSWDLGIYLVVIEMVFRSEGIHVIQNGGRHQTMPSCRPLCSGSDAHVQARKDIAEIEERYLDEEILYLQGPWLVVQKRVESQ